MIRPLRSRWERVVLVCAKCERKLDKNGFGQRGDKRLSKLLRRADAGGKGRKARLGVVSTNCLNVCPRGGVTIVDADRPGEWLVIEAGTPMGEVRARLAIGRVRSEIVPDDQA